ncbi:large subunit ribosomal protein LP2 protein [Dioscorea alata]|uniref:Large subunit ribosomal protein LP2 protein n=1 Tax=Dioscorea alata TaxID=55571 RepID=A0ACB7VCA9_DIOAL|nr:large subunit ribosomal protein LP2 protein [Dioscorea alata]
MKIIAAYLLALLGGNLSPSADDLKNILGSVGAETDEDKFEFFLSEVKGKDITELIALGKEKLASVPAGGGGGGALVVATPAGGAATAGAAAAEPKKEEKVEEKEESDDDMGFSLFD